MQSRFTLQPLRRCCDRQLHVRPVTAPVIAQIISRSRAFLCSSRHFSGVPTTSQHKAASFDLNAAIAQREAAEKAAAAASVRALIKSAANGGDLPLAVSAVSLLASTGGKLSADDFRVLIVSQLQSQEPHATAVAEGILQKASEAGFSSHASLLQPRTLLHVARGEAVKGADLLREAAIQTRDACAGGPRIGVSLRQVAVAENTGFLFGSGVASLDQLLRSSAAWNTAARQHGAIAARESSALFKECCTAFAARALQLQRMQLSLFREIAAECAGDGASQHTGKRPDAASTAAAITALLAVEKARQHDFWALQLLCIETARYLVHAGSPLPAAEALRTATDMLLVLSEQHRAALAAAVEEWADVLLLTQVEQAAPPAASATTKSAHPGANVGRGGRGPAPAPSPPLHSILPRHILAAMLPLARPPTSTFNAWVWAWEQAHERGQAPAGTAAAEVARLVAVMSSTVAPPSPATAPSASAIAAAAGSADGAGTDASGSASASRSGASTASTASGASSELESAPGTMASALEAQLRAWEAGTREVRWAKAAAIGAPPRRASWSSSGATSATSSSSAATDAAASAAAAAQAKAELAAAADTAAALASSAALSSVPDQVTFNHYLTLISASGYADEAARVPELMASAGVPPDASTYETLLRAALRSHSSSSSSRKNSSNGDDAAVADDDAGAADSKTASNTSTPAVQRPPRGGATPAERASAHRALEDSLDRMVTEALGRGIRISSAMLTMRLRASAEGGFMGRAARTLRTAEEQRIPLLSGALSSLLLGFARAGRIDAAVHLFAHTPGVLPPFASSVSVTGGVANRSRGGEADAEYHDDDSSRDSGGAGIVNLSHGDTDSGLQVAVGASAASTATVAAFADAAAALIQPLAGVPLADASTFRTIATALLGCGYLHDTVDLLEAFGIAAQGEMIVADSSRTRGHAARAAAASRYTGGAPGLSAWLLAPGDAVASDEPRRGSSSSGSNSSGDARVAKLVNAACLPRLNDAAYTVIMRSCLGVAAAHVGLAPPGLVAAAQISETLPPLRRGPQWFQTAMLSELHTRVLDTSRLRMAPSRGKPRDSLAARLCPDESAWRDSGLQSPTAADVESDAPTDARDALMRLLRLCKQRPPDGRHFHGQFSAIEWRELERRL